MKLLHADPDRIVFQLSAAEKRLLRDLLERYPCVPPAHHRLNREDDDAQKRWQRLPRSGGRATRAKPTPGAPCLTIQRRFNAPTAWRLTLRRGDFEWLLQVLNDVRVGSWIALGSPEVLPRQLPDDPREIQQLLAMELAGLFQTLFLEALEVPPAP